MISRFIVSCLFIFVSAAQPLAASEKELEELVINQLKCREKPNPLPVLLLLEKYEKIRADELVGYDSISCFRIHGGISVRGLTLRSICAYENSAGIREVRPDLLYRGPGTAPNPFISFGTTVEFKGVQEWYLSNIGIEYLNRAIETERTTFGDNTEISCKDYFRDKY